MIFLQENLYGIMNEVQNEDFNSSGLRLRLIGVLQENLFFHSSRQDLQWAPLGLETYLYALRFELRKPPSPILTKRPGRMLLMFFHERIDTNLNLIPNIRGNDLTASSIVLIQFSMLICSLPIQQFSVFSGR